MTDYNDVKNDAKILQKMNKENYNEIKTMMKAMEIDILKGQTIRTRETIKKIVEIHKKAITHFDMLDKIVFDVACKDKEKYKRIFSCPNCKREIKTNNENCVFHCGRCNMSLKLENE